MELQKQTSASTPHIAGLAPSFVVGQNRLGQWLAIETDGTGGGIFASRDAALRYAASESDRRPEAVRIAAAPIELRI